MALPPNATNEAAECTTAKVQPQQPRGRTTMKANRIQELEKLATEVEHSHGAFGEYEKYYRLNTEKFAKLIVKECGYLIQQQVSLKYKDGWEQDGITDDWAYGHYAASILSRTVIKQHFGV